jgi:hypothetical protein
MANQRDSESTVSVYEDVREVVERLRAIDVRLATPPIQAEPAYLRAKKHVTAALRELSQLAELLEGIHTRPKDGSRGTTRDVS